MKTKRAMKRKFTRLCFILILLIVSTSCNKSPHSCSTFMLLDNGVLLVGHNLDNPRWKWKKEPGAIFINKRNTHKRSVSGYELKACDKKHVIEWVSKYGSVTFNSYTRELPDGGMNEAGLVINEMSNGYNDYAFYDSLPTMMVSQWIQYQLDNYATIEELLQNINDINIVPWGLPAPIGGNNWHFFVSDKTGTFAIIEFYQGEVIIYYKETAPIPVLCNNWYQKDIDKIKKYKGFGGKKKIILKPKLFNYWFNQAAYLLKYYDKKADTDPVKYAFKILEKMQRPLCEQWSIIYDVKNMRIYYRTYFASKIKYFDVSTFDFGIKDVKMLPDIHLDCSGDISNQFVPYSYQQNCEIVEESLKGFLKAYKKLHNYSDTSYARKQYIEKRKELVLKILIND